MNISLVVRTHWPAPGGSEVYQHVLASRLAESHNVQVIAQGRDYGHQFGILEQTLHVKRFEPYFDGRARVVPLYPRTGDRALLSPFLLFRHLYYNTPLVSRYKQTLKHLYLPLFAAAYRRHIAALIKGYTWGEMSWILETNDMMNRGIEMMGAEVYKTYRIYQKSL